MMRRDGRGMPEWTGESVFRVVCTVYLWTPLPSFFFFSSLSFLWRLSWVPVPRSTVRQDPVCEQVDDHSNQRMVKWSPLVVTIMTEINNAGVASPPWTPHIVLAQGKGRDLKHTSENDCLLLSPQIFVIESNPDGRYSKTEPTSGTSRQTRVQVERYVIIALVDHSLVSCIFIMDVSCWWVFLNYYCWEIYWLVIRHLNMM